MGSSQHFYPEAGYPSPLFPHRRAMWATAVAVACGVIGLAVRARLVEWLPGTEITVILVRATVLCVVGGGIYLALARLFGIRELASFERMLLRRLRLRRPTLRDVGGAPPH
jgi:peptidoglycan biosynthesis protein MviN/MurJ (putative lipid II flippase)